MLTVPFSCQRQRLALGTVPPATQNGVKADGQGITPADATGPLRGCTGQAEWLSGRCIRVSLVRARV